MPAHTNLTFLSTRSSSQPFSGIPRVVSLFLGSHPDRKAGLGERPGEKSLIVYTRERGGLATVAVAVADETHVIPVQILAPPARTWLRSRSPGR